MMCTSCHCCRCLSPAQTFHIILQILFHKVLFRIEAGSLHGSVYIYDNFTYRCIYICISRLCKLVLYLLWFLKSAEKLRSLESYLEITSCWPLCLRTKHLFLLKWTRSPTMWLPSHERLNVGGDWSLWENLWHHSPGRSIGLSFCSRLLCGQTLNGGDKVEHHAGPLFSRPMAMP